MADATKVRAENGKILRIGKNLTDYNCIDTGLFICSKVLIDTLSAVYQDKGDASLSDGIQKLCERSTMHAIDIGDGFWQDVDNAEMLRHAEQQFVLRRSGAILQQA
jgi:1L-myo-inositol 1-phosphate cytidylyltransferase